MSVANILDTPVNTYQKIDPLWETSGGGGGPFLPLAGGTMNAFPAGVINAHTIDGLITLEGTNAGSGVDTTIQTNAGNDLLINTTSADGVVITTGEHQINTSIRTEINGTTVIQPVGGYTYPNNPEAGLTIQNWNNPNPAQMIGLLVKDTDAPNSTSFGIKVDNVGRNTGTTNSIGLDIGDVKQDKTAVGSGSIGSRLTGVEGNFAYGYFLNGVDGGAGGSTMFDATVGTAVGDCLGVRVNQLSSSSGLATGIIADNIISATGVATAGEFKRVNGNSISYGVYVDDINDAVGDANGVSVNLINGNTEARGMYIQNVNASSSYAAGVDIDGITANGAGQDARGVSVNNMISDGNCVGVEARVLDSVSQTTTGFSASLLTATAQVFGARLSAIGSASGVSEAYGVDMTNIRQDRNAATSIASGVNMTNVSAFDATGVQITTVYGNQRADGIRISDVKNDNVAFPAYGLVAGRGTKLAASSGQLMRLLDGNLGLAVQYLNNPVGPQQVFGDAGNLCIIGAAAPAGPASISLVAPPGGWEDGHWFLFCKVAAVGHGIFDTAGNPINGVVPPPSFIFPPGAAYDMCILFFSVAFGGWVANAF